MKVVWKQHTLNNNIHYIVVYLGVPADRSTQNSQTVCDHGFRINSIGRKVKLELIRCAKSGNVFSVKEKERFVTNPY